MLTVRSGNYYREDGCKVIDVINLKYIWTSWSSFHESELVATYLSSDIDRMTSKFITCLPYNGISF